MIKRKDGFEGERSIVLPQMIVDVEANDPLVSSLYITDIGYYPKAENHYRERLDGISQNVLIYCVKGTGWYQVGEQKFQVGENQFFILPASTPHAYGSYASDPWTIYWIHFKGIHSSIYTQGNLTPHDIKASINSRIGDRNQIFEEIFNTLYNGYSLENLRYVTSMLHYYLASMQYIQQFRRAPHKKEENCQDGESIINAVIHYMNENLERKITLQEIAAYAGYSVSYISSLFKQHKQQSPINYLNKLKIDKSCEILSSSNIKICQLCHKVGIDDPYYFSRLFTRLTGVSPTEYQRLNNRTI